MKTFFTINGVLEVLAGIIFLFAASKVPGLENAGELTTYWVGMYGAAALAIGVLSFLVVQEMNNAGLVRVFLMVGIVFHVGVALLNFVNLGGQVDTLPVAILHGVMAAGFLYFYFKNK